MSAPLLADPLGGPTDPTVIQHQRTGQWWMFYTQRRPHARGLGVEWVHGSRIGTAVSDDGAAWRYRGVVEGLDPANTPGRHTHWAPEVAWDGNRYHMYLSWIHGVPSAWAGHERHIAHLTSPDLVCWEHHGFLALGFRYVIDAAVATTADGRVRLWYKDEADGSTTHAAVSQDWHTFAVEGQVIGGVPHEGPNVFALDGWQWLIADEWCGQRVYRSDDGVTWSAQGRILDIPGFHAGDRQVGRHADVVVRGKEAVVFYFTHPHWGGSNAVEAQVGALRESTVHRARLWVSEGVLRCDRDVPAASPLPPGRGRP
ncbi:MULTISPECIES: glycosyl hydrolase [unclassified Arthrobacter]|uniref:glycosyl hydrolase n=1 Tax=unclassified Arthrobacter TaxID=235627 RepID=UPI0014921C1C|nr:MULTISPECIES: glycosyl hydrolase [unclassified Arthrobacter]MBE0010379.1 glycosyl hydrolase [Arthrobacter sp. AET 35A]NOJ64298.1 glycosyl hydrolase [Arthrobacter sp. 147(2020)]